MSERSITMGQVRAEVPQVQIAALSRGWLKSAIYRMQYAQMIRAMNMLPDDVLKEIGVKRDEIRQHCKKLLD